MDQEYTKVAVGLLFAGLLYVLFSIAKSFATRRTLPLPPGPRGAWFSPGPKMPLKLAELGETYGPVCSYRRGKELVCVINGYRAATEILQKQGVDTLDRPRLIAASEILSGGMRTVLTRAGPRIRKLRRALLTQLGLAAVVQYQPLQMKNAREYILDLLSDPEGHMDHARRYAASVVMSMTYGKLEPTNINDPDVQGMKLYMSRFTKYMPVGSHVVDGWPILKYVPFVTSDLQRWHHEEASFYKRLINNIREKMAAHTAQPCFTSYLLEHQQQFDLNDNELGFLTGSMYGAGSETTAAALMFMVMAAAKYPEEAAKVRVQLDAVIGYNRLPTFDDVDALPRVRAFFWEVFRWRPVFWGGIAHCAVNDVIWNGYVIPRGATIIGNHWGIGRDPEAYPEPHKFNPDRWLDEQGNFREDMSFCNYGFGRRFCVGQYLANNSMFINTALVLWAFDVQEVREAPIDVMALADGATIHPLPFKVVFKPRMENLKAMIESYAG